MKTVYTTAMFLALSVSSASAFEFYGGASFGGQDLNYGPQAGNPQTMDPGFVLGGGHYWPGPQNWSFGVDVMLTAQDYSIWGPGATLSTLSVMGVARHEFPSQAPVTPYVSGGIGAIAVSYAQPSASFLDGTDSIAGYQLEAGVRFQMPGYTAFTAVKYQAGFDQAFIQTEYVEYDSLSVIAGVAW